MWKSSWVRTTWVWCALMMVAVGHPLVGQSSARPSPRSAADSNFEALQARGRVAMGVDQYASTHRFDDLPDGGRIELQVVPTDTAGVRAIREHLRGIAGAFQSGDFRTPGLVHARTVPGTEVMRAERRLITYRFVALPGGGEVRIVAASARAVAAVHSFLAFQRREHHAGGTDLPMAEGTRPMTMTDSLARRVDSSTVLPLVPHVEPHQHPQHEQQQHRGTDRESVVREPRRDADGGRGPDGGRRREAADVPALAPGDDHPAP